MLVEVPYEYVAKFRSAAAKAHVSVSPTKRTRWFRSEGEEGFCGLIEVSARVVRIKGVYVHPDHRGKGIGTAMTDELIAEAEKGTHDTLEVLAYNPAFYEKRRFRRKSQLGNGAWRLERQ